MGSRPGGRKTLILNSHIDTEPWQAEAARWTVPPLDGTVAGGRIFGRGAVDAKGQVMTAVLALCALKDLGYVPPGRIVLQSVVGEEPSGNGTLALCLAANGEAAGRTAAVVLEPTEGHVAYAHRGILGLRFVVSGGASHAAFGTSSNAIVTAGILANILQSALEDWASPADHVFGPPTVNVGRISGGANIFSSPIGCTIECGVRYAPGTADLLLKHLINMTSARFETETGFSWAQIGVHLFDHFDAGETPADAPLVHALLRSVQAVQPDRCTTVFPGGCDARHFMNRLGLPTVIFGPGSLRQAHGVDEYMDIEAWMAAASALATFVATWQQTSNVYRPVGME